MISRAVRRACRWGSSLWLALLLTGPLAAHEVPRGAPPEAIPFVLAEASRAWLEQYPVIRVGVASGWEPIEFIDDEGRYQGIVADWMSLIAERLGVRFEYVHRDNWDEVMEAFYRGEIEVLATLTETPERRARMLFTEPYLNFDTGLVTRDDAPYSEKLADLPAGRLAAVKGFASSAAALQRAPHLSALPVNSTQEALLAVSTGKADVAVVTVLVAHYLARQHGLANLRIGADHDDYPAGLAMAVRSDLEPLRDILQSALDSVTIKERTAINSHWVDLQQVRAEGLSSATRLTLLILLAGLLIMTAWVYTLRRQIVLGRRQQRRAEAAEQRLADIATSAPGVLWQYSRDRQGKLRCLYISQGAERTTGIPTAQALGEAETILATIHPEDQPAVLRTLGSCTPEQGQHEYRHRLRTRQGRWIWVQVTIAAQQQRDGNMLITGFSRDITAQQRLEADLLATQQRLRDLAEGVPGALWQFRRELDGLQHYSYMSDGIVQLTGRTPEETNQLMKDKSFVSVHPDDLPILQALMQRLTDKIGIEEARYRLRTAEGGWKWVQVAARAMPMGADGAVVWNGITLDATRIHQVEETLREERQRLEDLADSFAGALWRMSLSKDGAPTFEYVSKGIKELTGNTPEMVLGGGVNPFERVAAEDLPRLRAALAHSAETLTPLEVEFTYRRIDGRDFRLALRAGVRQIAGRPVWTGVGFDTTERHRLMRALDDARGRIDDITANFPGAIFQMQRSASGSQHFTYMSENILGITGRPAIATLDKPELPFQVMHPDDRERVQKLLDETAAALGSAHIEYRLLTESGEYRWVTASFTARRQPDGSLVWNGILLDASEQKRLEAELRAASESAEAASRAKSRFLANMSHEIRTPMNAVIGLAHLAMTSATDPVQAERIGKVHSAGRALLKLLNDILEYSRLDARKVTPQAAPFDLHEMRDALQLFCSSAAEAKGLGFAIECAPELPLRWLGDATRIQQVLLNLLTNAIKFTDTGRVRLLMQMLLPGQSGLCFEVHDTGIGMSAAELVRVFEAFEQASGEIERRHGGSGLGLSISKGLVDALGGQLRVKSAPGEGTVFTVELPLQRAAVGSQAAGLLQGDATQRLMRLAEHIAQRDSAAVRNTLQALRLALIAKGQAQEIHVLERLLAEFDFDAARLELARLHSRWSNARN